MPGRNSRGGGPRQWMNKNNNNTVNQNKNPRPLMQRMTRPALQYQNQMGHNNQQVMQRQQPMLQHQQQQQQRFAQPEFLQTQLTSSFGAGMNQIRQVGNSFMHGQVPAVQAQMQMQQQSFGNVSNPLNLLNQQFQQSNQNQHVQQSFTQQQTLPQQMQQAFTQQPQQNLIQQQQLQTNYLQQYQQNLPQQSPSFQHQPQHNFAQQQQAFTHQWQLNLSNSNQASTADNLNFYQAQLESAKPPLPPVPPPPPPPANLSSTPINPPLPPPEMKAEKYDFGKILSTNLPGLMEIISGKNKNENKIPGLDLVTVPTPSPKVPPLDLDPIEVVDLIQADTPKNEKVTDSGESRPGPQQEAPSYGPGVATAKIINQTVNQPPPPPPHQDIPIPSIPPTVESQVASNFSGFSVASSTPVISDSGHQRPSDLPGSGTSAKAQLLAFDKKFREWEKQFEDWKKESSGHPDRGAYGNYLAQWEAWREQLIQQRRFIIENINKDKEDRAPPVPRGGGDSNSLLKTWNAEPQPSSAQTGNVTTPAFSESVTQNQLTAQQPSTTLTNEPPKVEQPPVQKDSYEIRDLSKLIQNPFAVTGGPVSFEQRRFIKSQPIVTPQQQQQQQHPSRMGVDTRPQFGGASFPSSAAEGQQRPVGRNPFDVNSREPKLPSLLDSTTLMKKRRPTSPVERVARRPPSPIGRVANPVNSFAKLNSYEEENPMPPRRDFDDFQRRPQHVTPPTDNFEFLRRGSRADDISADDRHATEPVTFDYGHGSNSIVTESLFSRERSSSSGYETGARGLHVPEVKMAEEDDATETVIDYGHGTSDPVTVIPATQVKEQGTDEEDSYHDRYNQDPPEEEIEPPYYYEHPPPPHFYPGPGPGFRGRMPFPFPGGPPFRGMFRGRGMPPPMRGFPPRPPFFPFRHPHPGMYHEGYEYDYPYPPHPFHHGPPEEHFPMMMPGPRPPRPIFPITDFERPVRIAPPPSAENQDLPPRSRSPEFRQAPPRDTEPISPEPMPEESNGDSRERDRGRRGRDRERSSSRGRERNRSGDRVRRNPDRSSRERDRDISPFSRRKREGSPRRDRRGRSRSRSPRGYKERDQRGSPDRRSYASTGRRASSPPPSSSTRAVLIEDILNIPGRNKRPGHIVIVLRGLPGSGKTHVARLIKDRETELGGTANAPRILSLDDFFMNEEKKTVRDPVTGKETKESVTTYEYDAAQESKYRDDLFKTFRKTVEAGYFHFIIVDCVNEKFRHFQEMTNFAKAKRFQVYVVEMEGKAEECAKKNIHNRSLEEIKDIEKNWERTPSYFIKLDVRNLLQDEAPHHVEMGVEDVSDVEDLPGDDEEVQIIEGEDEDEPWATSKWETSEDKLNKLDGLKRKRKNADSEDEEEVPESMEKWLQTQVPEDYSYRREALPGKKRVRWADIEARREQERAREIGFVVGHTDWSQITNPSFASSALTKTKYI